MTKIISLIIFVIFIITYLLLNKKYLKIQSPTSLTKKIKKLQIMLYIITIIMLLSLFFVKLLHTEEYNINNILNTLVETLPLVIIILPLEIPFLCNKYLATKETNLYIKTIITSEKISKKILQNFNKAGINIISDNSENIKYLKEIKSEELKHNLRKNIYIENINLNHLKNNSTIYVSETKLDDVYKDIHESRATFDNIGKAIKTNTLTYLPLLISFIFLTIMSFPIKINLELIILIKITSIIFTNYLYINFPKDIDLMTRKPIIENKYFSKQDIFLTIFQSMFIFFASNLIYIYLLSSGAEELISHTIFITIIIYSNLFTTLINITEKNIFNNLIYIVKNKYLLVYSIILIIFSIIINYINIFNTTNIGIQNYLSCILIAFIFNITYEITKIARLTTMKGTKKNGIKNNKKN